MNIFMITDLKHKCFRMEQQSDGQLVDQLARKLAKIHSMDVPIKKSSNWTFHFFDTSYKVANERFDLNSLYEECNCETLKAKDLKEELENLKQLIIKADSPKTFTHVDFRGSNIMLTETDGMVLCDFEYSCNDFRGVDFGTLFTEWGREIGTYLDPWKFTDDHTIKPFIDSYIDESTKLFGEEFASDPRNSFEHILRETKVFSLVGIMFFVLFSLKIKDSVIEDFPFDKKKTMV